jgi:hypothetical protein
VYDAVRRACRQTDLLALFNPSLHSLSAGGNLFIHNITGLFGMDPRHGPRLLDALSGSDMPVGNRWEPFLIFPK